MKENTNKHTVMFFRDQSEFCISVSEKLKQDGIQFSEVLKDSSEYVEFPIIISSRFGCTFKGQPSVRRFLSMVGIKSE